MISPPDRIETNRLVLRRPHLSDTDNIYDNYGADPEVTHYVTWRPYKNRREVGPFSQSRLARWDSGEEYSWAITQPDKDCVIGMIAFRVRGHAADIGYVLGRSFWNHGYITEAANPIVDWGIHLDSVYRVWAVCDVENKASVQVLEKGGMQREGILRRHVVQLNVSSEPRDCSVYSKIR